MVGSLPSLHLYPQGQSDSGERSRHCFIFSVISSSKPQERWILCCHLTFLWPNLSPTLERVRGCCLQRLLVILNLEHAGSSRVHSEESKALSPALKSLLGNMLQQESESWSQPGGEKGLLSLHFSFRYEFDKCYRNKNVHTGSHLQSNLLLSKYCLAPKEGTGELL